jgi:arginase
MGLGPDYLLANGLLQVVRDFDPDAVVTSIECEEPFLTEIGSAFELHRKLAINVVQSGGFPIVLSGNCNSAIGTVAGLLASDPKSTLGVIWLDGHGDCNTPETFTGSFLDAMGLSTLTGRCWQAMCATIPGFCALPDQHVALVGGHGADKGALSILAESQITHVKSVDIERIGAAAMGPAVDELRAHGVQRVYIHLDLDVIDAAYARANTFAPVGGLLPDQLADAVCAVASRLPVAAIGMASYDPTTDVESKLPSVAGQILKRVVSTTR